MDNNDIKVSVCCLVYNHEKYLRKCLDGFVMQKTNFAFEVLINEIGRASCRERVYSYV